MRTGVITRYHSTSHPALYGGEDQPECPTMDDGQMQYVAHNNSQSRLVSGTGPRYQNSSLGPVPVSIIDVWDRSQFPLLMSGTGPSFHY